jgi:hypothetical protein
MAAQDMGATETRRYHGYTVSGEESRTQGLGASPVGVWQVENSDAIPRVHRFSKFTL